MTNALVPSSGLPAAESAGHGGQWHSGSQPAQARTLAETAKGREYAAALAVQFENPRLYRTAEHQAKLLRLAGEFDGPENTVEGEISPSLTETRAALSDLQRELQAEGTWAEVAESFDALPSKAIAAVQSELLDPPPVRQAEASPELLARIGADAAGRIFIQEAGRDAPRRAARLCERYQRIHARLARDVGAGNSLGLWFDRLGDLEAAAVMNVLAR
jgi:hypothetical protein